MEQETEKNIQAKSTGFGIASLVLGIISIIFLYYIIISVISAVLAIVFGIIALRKDDRTFGKTGLALGIVSLVITLLLFLFLDVLDVSIFMIPDWYKF